MNDNLPINKVLEGDCREVMAEWPEDCIDFVCFSPPYWGLRDYGEEAKSMWGGDEDCDHVWGEELDRVGNRNRNDTGNLTNADEMHSDIAEGLRNSGSGSFCQKCGAWRGQLGLEPDYRMYVEHLVEIGREIKRILKPSGSWYLNLGDTYAGSGGAGGDWMEGSRAEEPKWKQGSSGNIKDKCKMLMPYRVALALINDGWICRNDIIWLKPNPMPSSVKDRLNTTTERIFHFVKEKKYYYDLDAIREEYSDSSIQRVSQNNGNPNFNGDRQRSHPNNAKETLNPDQFTNPKGKNPGDVIEQTTQPFPEAHFAVYPPELCEKPIKSSCPPKVCSKCGKPYEREEHEKQYIDTRPGNNTGKGKSGKKIDPNKSLHSSEVSKKRQKIIYHLSDNFKKTCSCSIDETEPGIVLDPMCGAGSTLKIAEKLGRKYIGIEINPEYANMARRRVSGSIEQKIKPKRKEPPEEVADLEAFA